jgi:hypothetical protein
MIFDRAGALIERDTNRCQWSGYDVIKTLNPDSAYRIIPGLRAEQFLADLHPLDTIAGPDSLQRQADFTIVVTWAKFLGTYNDRLFELAGAVSLNNTAHIRMIWLNVDMQEGWKLTKDQKMEIK